MKNPFANLFKKKTDGTPNIVPAPSSSEKKESFFSKFFKNKLGKSSVQGEEIIGVDFSNNEIRLAQINSDKSNQWILQKFYAHKFEGIPEDANILDHQDKIADELKIALQKGKFDTSNAAIAIPVTSAIIRVVTSPLMTDEELNNAVKTDSLWENLVQLTERGRRRDGSLPLAVIGASTCYANRSVNRTVLAPTISGHPNRVENLLPLCMKTGVA